MARPPPTPTTRPDAVSPFRPERLDLDHLPRRHAPVFHLRQRGPSLAGTSNDGGAQPQSFAYALGEVSVTDGTGDTSQPLLQRAGPGREEHRPPGQRHAQHVRRQLQPDEGHQRPGRVGNLYLQRRGRGDLVHRLPGQHDPLHLFRPVQRPRVDDRRQREHDQLLLQLGRRPAEHDLRQRHVRVVHLRPRRRRHVVPQRQRPADQLHLQRRRTDR